MEGREAEGGGGRGRSQRGDDMEEEKKTSEVDTRVKSGEGEERDQVRGGEGEESDQIIGQKVFHGFD